MGERIDWDRSRRQNLVRQQGSEPSEFLDITKQIAKAKGYAKVRGPMLRACTGCGKYYDEYAEIPHVCRPRRKPERATCPYCGSLVSRERLDAHKTNLCPKAPREIIATRPVKKREVGEELNSRHPPSIGRLVKCRKCGEEVEISALRSHLRQAHPRSWWPNPPPKGVTIKCKYCGRLVKLRGLKDHNRAHHSVGFAIKFPPGE